MAGTGQTAKAMLDFMAKNIYKLDFLRHHIPAADTIRNCKML